MAGSILDLNFLQFSFDPSGTNLITLQATSTGLTTTSILLLSGISNSDVSLSGINIISSTSLNTRDVRITGTVTSLGVTSGSLLITGGAGISGSVTIGSTLSTSLISHLTGITTSELWTNSQGSIKIGNTSNVLNLNAGIINSGTTNTSLSILSGITGSVYHASNDIVQTNAMNTWTNLTIDAAKVWTSVCYSKIPLFVAIANNGGVALGQVYTSPDGTTWTPQSSSAPRNWRSVCVNDNIGLFCAVADSGGVGGQVMTSPNGFTWTARNSSAASPWQCIASGDSVVNTSIFVAVASNGGIMSSTGGELWVNATSPAVRQWGSVCYSRPLNLFCAVARDGTTADCIITSTTGSTAWTTRTAPNASNWQSVCWSDKLNLFCAVGSGGIISNQVMTSSNGITWTARTSASLQQWQAVCWSEPLEIFCAVANNGATDFQIMTSPNGINWTARTAPNTNTWSSIASGCCNVPRIVSFANTASVNSTMYSSTIFPGQNRDLLLGTLASSKIRSIGNDIVLYNVPYYYGQTSILKHWNTTLPVTDIIIYNVPAGTYMFWLYASRYSRQSTTADRVLITGSVDGVLFNTGTINYAAATVGPVYYSGLISVSTTQSVFSQFVPGASSTAIFFTGPTPRTFYLQRIA